MDIENMYKTIIFYILNIKLNNFKSIKQKVKKL